MGTWRVNEVDQVADGLFFVVCFLFGLYMLWLGLFGLGAWPVGIEVGATFTLRQIERQRNGSGFDGDGSFLLIGTNIKKSRHTRAVARDETGATDEGIRESGLAVIYMRYYTHVSDVVCVVLTSFDAVNEVLFHHT